MVKRIALFAGLLLLAGCSHAPAPRATAPAPMLYGAGVGQAQPNPLPLRGKGHFDPRTHGWDGVTNVGDVLQATFDEAEAWRASTGIIPTVHLPASSGTKTLDKPVWLDGGGCNIVAEDGLVLNRGTGYHGFLVGISRAGGAPAANSTYRPDLHGLLDTSAAATTGVRWGLDTGASGDGWIVAQAGPLSHGPVSKRWTVLADRWRETPVVTIDFAVRARDGGQLPANTVLFGLGTDGPGAFPFYVKTGSSANSFVLCFSTQAARFGPIADHTATIAADAATGTQRVTFTLDLGAGTCYAAKNNLQVTPTLAGGSFVGATFNENWYVPFVVNGYWQGGASGGGLFELLGLDVSASARYANRGAGQAQVVHPQIASVAANHWRVIDAGWSTGGTFTVTGTGGTGTVTIAGGSPSNSSASVLAAVAAALGVPTTSLSLLFSQGGSPGVPLSANWPPFWDIAGINGYTLPTATAGMCDGSNLTGQTIVDLYRYFPNSATTDGYAIAYLPFAEDPSTSPRHLTLQGGTLAGGAPCSALLLTGGSTNSLTPLAAGYKFKGLNLQGGNSPYGALTNWGHALTLEYRDCTINGGLYAIGCLPWGANYYHTIEDCNLQAADAAIFLFDSIASARNLTSGANGSNRHYVLSVSSTFNASRVELGGSGADPIAMAVGLQGGYAGTLNLDQWSSDNEGLSPYALAGIYYQTTGDAGNNLWFKNISLPQIGSAPGIKLNSSSGPPSFFTTRVHIDSCQLETSGPTIDADAGFVGEAINTLGGFATQVTNSRTADPPAIVVRDEFFATPQRGGGEAWGDGTYRVEPPAPADAQYRQIDMPRGGLFGSPTPPRYAGRWPDQADPAASIAGYALDHTSIGATITGQPGSSQGFLTDYGAQQLIRAWVGTPPTPPTTIYAGLLTAKGTRLGNNPAEPTYQNQDPTLSATGYHRVAITNNTTNFPASSSGSKASGAAITFPTFTGTPTIQSIALYDSAPAVGGAVTVSGGTITAAPVAFGGGGYTSAPPVEFISGGNVVGRGTGNLTGGVVTSITVTSSNSGLTAGTVGCIIFPPATSNCLAVINFAAPVTVSGALAINSGALTFSHAPYKGDFRGGMTDYAWGKSFDWLFGGTSFAQPSSLYLGYGTSAVTKASTAIGEPSGNGYARVPVAAGSGWGIAGVSEYRHRSGEAVNAAALAFPAPTGSQGGPMASGGLFDASSSGNLIWQFPWTVPITPAVGDPPTVAAGALIVSPG